MISAFLKRQSQIFFPLFLLGLVILLRVATPETVESLQFKVFDLFQQLKPRAYAEAPVAIVDLDDETLSKVGQWPWPRTQVAQLIARLAGDGASVIAMDMVFAEPDRTSPENILPLWPKTPDLEAVRAPLEKLPHHDNLLAQAIQEARVVTAFGLTGQPNSSRPVQKAGFAFAGDNPAIYLPHFQGAVVNLPALAAAAAGSGSFSILPEKDGVIRRAPLLLCLKDALYPSLVLETLRVAQGASGHMVKSSGSSHEISFGEHTGIVSVKTGNFIIPTDGEGRIWLYDSGSRAERFFPAWKVLAGNFAPGFFTGKIIYVGTSATGLKDLRTTPLTPFAAGVEIHAQLTEQILLQNFLYRPDWAPGLEFLFLLLTGLLIIFLMARAGALGCALVGLSAAGGVCAFSWYAFVQRHWLLDPVLPSAAVLLVYLSSSLVHFLKTESERSQIRNAFSHYMSPALVEKLVKHPELLKLGGESRNLTFLFSDIRGFTSISENLNPQEITRFMNRFLTPMTGIILEHNGTIDKYIGDCIMAFWNAPLDDAEHAAHACAAALRMRDYLVEWNEELRAETQAQGRPFFPVHIGIGLNTGDCCVGNIGSDQRFDYSVLGDEVNLASRLEGQAKIYGVDIIAGLQTYENAKDFAGLEIDLVRVKGKKKAAHVFGLLSGAEMKESEGFKNLQTRHREMLAVYRARDWERALQRIEECLKLDTPKTRLRKLYQLYQERIQAFKISPPSPDWDGSADALSK